MRLDLAIVQDVGKRSEQQDSATAHGLPSGNGVMLVIADGLGGHVGGATASRLAIETFADATQTGVFDAHQQRRSALVEAMNGANQRISDASRNVGPKETMGTTLVSAIVADGAVRWISVGDSHLYLWRAGGLSKLNEDHSQAGLMVSSGRFKPDDAELDPYRSLLRSALTGRGIELIDNPELGVSIAPGDVIVLASDGLNTVANTEIERILTTGRNEGAELLAARLIDEVRRRDSANQDNTSVVVACIDSIDAAMDVPKDLTSALTAVVRTELSPTVPRTTSAERAETTAVVTTPVLAGTEAERGAALTSAGQNGALVSDVPHRAARGLTPAPARSPALEVDKVFAPAARKATSLAGPVVAVVGLASLAALGYIAYQMFFAPQTAPPPVPPIPVTPSQATPAARPAAVPAPPVGSTSPPVNATPPSPSPSPSGPGAPPARRNDAPSPQGTSPQSPSLQNPSLQNPSPQAPGPQTPGPQAPGPQAPGPQAPGPQAPGPQAPGPQGSVPAVPVPPVTLPQGSTSQPVGGQNRGPALTQEPRPAQRPGVPSVPPNVDPGPTPGRGGDVPRQP